jgi:hypothetical protein
MIVFDPDRSHKGLTSYIPRTEGNCYAKQIHETFQVKGKKSIGNPGDYLVRFSDNSLTTIPKKLFEQDWKLFWNPRNE